MSIPIWEEAGDLPSYYKCNIHGCDNSQCECPTFDVWQAAGRDPYVDEYNDEVVAWVEENAIEPPVK